VVVAGPGLPAAGAARTAVAAGADVGDDGVTPGDLLYADGGIDEAFDRVEFVE
jgi:hypothetical protein